MTKAIISENRATLSISEHDALLSKIRSEVAKAHAEILEAMSMVSKRNQRSDALRIESVFSNGCGQRLRLKCYTIEYVFLMQGLKDLKFRMTIAHSTLIAVKQICRLYLE